MKTNTTPLWKRINSWLGNELVVFFRGALRGALRGVRGALKYFFIKKNGRFRKLSLVYILFVFIWFLPSTQQDFKEMVEATENLPTAPTKTPAQIHNERVKSLFSGWDGSHRKLVHFVKNAMNDANSFEHIETTYWDMKDHLVVNMRYRGSNAYGGIVQNFIKVKTDLDGTVLDVLQQ